MNALKFLALSLTLSLTTGLPLSADPPLSSESGSSVSGVETDQRGQNLKTLNGHFPFLVPKNADEWKSRSDALRRRVLVATGLWPMPEKTPLTPVIHGKIERKGFTVEKVYFESLPGHFVTGLLFRPSNPQAARLPAVLSPHGHGGRLQRLSDEELKKQIYQGAEHFADSGRMPKLARCAQLARMGCVTFMFDMLGYADSIQISHQVAHRYADVASDLASQSSENRWGLYSVQADLRLQSIMQIQTWNAIRSLDFLASLPDVDPDRLAVTGGSGGGTQTILLGAIDDRIKVGFPNGMVSTSMQGGCYCENCNLLRIDTGNVELAALFAPKPQAMTAADDWTKAMMSDGYPELQRIYAMTGDQADVYCRPMLHFKHNYNYVTRATMYQWMNRHLNLGLDDPVVEQDFKSLTDEEMAVWNDDHPAPKETGFAHQRNVCGWFDRQAKQQMANARITNQESLKKYHKQVGEAWNVIFDRELPQDFTYSKEKTATVNDRTVEYGTVSVDAQNSHLPTLTIRNAGANNKRVYVWSLDGGKSAVLNRPSVPIDLAMRLTSDGSTLIVADLYHQGENMVQGVSPDEQPLIKDKRPYSAFTFGYNRTAVVQRSADLMAIVAHVASTEPDSIRLIGSGSAALWVVPTAAKLGKSIDDVVITDGDIRFANAKDYSDVTFVPGAAKYGDIPALLALRAPYRLTVIANEPAPKIVTKAYQAAGDSSSLQWEIGTDVSDSIIAWSKK